MGAFFVVKVGSSIFLNVVWHTFYLIPVADDTNAVDHPKAMSQEPGVGTTAAILRFAVPPPEILIRGIVVGGLDLACFAS